MSGHRKCLQQATNPFSKTFSRQKAAGKKKKMKGGASFSSHSKYNNSITAIIL